MQKEELRDLCPFPSITAMIRSRRMRWAVHIAQMVENRNVYCLLVGKSDGKNHYGRTRHRGIVQLISQLSN